VIALVVVVVVVMACIRSLVDTGGARVFGFILLEQWRLVDSSAKFYASWLLATALGAVGLGTGLAKLKGLGIKPFTVGFAAALSVGAVSFGLIKLLSTYLH
jgi:uncharacterized membrane protein YadS